MTSPRRLRATGARWAWAVAVALPLLAASTVFHTELESSEPAADAVVATAPTRITLTFTTDVQLALSSVVVRGGSRAVDAAEPGYLAEDRHEVLVLPLSAPLANGSHVVEWTTAGPDGHAISGSFSFRVEAPAPVESTQEPVVAAQDSLAPPPPAPASTTNEGGLLATAARWLYLMGIIGLLGAATFRFLVLPQLARGGEVREVLDGATTGAWRLASISVVALLVSAPLRLWFKAQAFPDAFGALLTQTPWGRGWWLHIGAGLLVLAGIALARPLGRRTPGWAVATLGILLLPLVPPLSGHAWAATPRALAVGFDYVHVLAAGAWMGTLFCLVFAGLPALKHHGVTDGSGQPGLPGMVNAFSRVALLAVGLLVVSGAGNAVLHLEGVSQLWTTAWGRWLLVKLAVVAGVLGLGFYNWRVVRPALAESPRPGLLKLPAVVELLLGAVAVAAASLLVVQPLN